ncbi:MAG: sensor histidine kinase [Kofleriaceae bacterium]
MGAWGLMSAAPPNRILVVDDHESILSDFARLLGQPTASVSSERDELAMGGAPAAAEAAPVLSRYKVRYLRQGEDAVREVSAAVAAHSPFAVAFVDIQMPPGIDGVETVARMWRHQPDLEIVLCTAYSDHSWDEILAKLSKPDQLVILHKPFDPIEVRQLAACLSEKWRRGRALAHRVQTLEARAATDVTARMQVELTRTQKFDALGRLAAGIAHEINTPTQYIRSSLEFLSVAIPQVMAQIAQLRATAVDGDTATVLDEIAAEIPDAIADASEGVERITKIVRSVGDYAHPSSAQKTAVDLNRQIRGAVELARNGYKQDADVVLELGELPLVHGQGDALGCAILNLLINASQAVQKKRGGGGPRGRITIASRVDGDFVAVDITDTGPGISAADRDRVFEPFFTTKPIGQGTGQGLSIARAIVIDAHRGSLTFDTEPGSGTTFHLCLPIAANEDSS